MSAYILVVLFVSGGFTAEFGDKLTCEDARQSISASYGKSSGFVNAVCLPHGGNKK